MARSYGGNTSVENKSNSSVQLSHNNVFGKGVVLLIVVGVLIVGLFVWFRFFRPTSSFSIRQVAKILEDGGYKGISVDEMLDLMEDNSQSDDSQLDGVYVIANSNDDIHRYFQFGVKEAGAAFDIDSLDRMLVGVEAGNSYNFTIYDIHCLSDEGAMNYYEQWKNNSSIDTVTKSLDYFTRRDTDMSDVSVSKEGNDNNVQYYFVSYELYDFHEMAGIWRSGKDLCIMTTTYTNASSRGLRRIADMCRALGIIDLEQTLSQQRIAQGDVYASCFGTYIADDALRGKLILREDGTCLSYAYEDADPVECTYDIHGIDGETIMFSLHFNSRVYDGEIIAGKLTMHYDDGDAILYKADTAPMESHKDSEKIDKSQYVYKRGGYAIPDRIEETWMSEEEFNNLSE